MTSFLSTFTAHYLFRLDDITPTMNMHNFQKCMTIFKENKVQPILGIIPHNEDPELTKFAPNPEFWNLMRLLQTDKKVSIAQHGFTHVYHHSKKSILYRYGIGTNTEFAGLLYEEQYQRIQKGKDILQHESLPSQIWMAPNHSFDKNTLRSLAALGFRIITDGIGIFPYRQGSLLFIPVLSGRPRKIPFGITTICLHPASMNDNDFQKLDQFLHQRDVVCITLQEAAQIRLPFFSIFLNFITRIIYFVIKKMNSIIK